jgi:peptidyl-prolyl cis-trans isomerase A (cyclophilin A)
MRRMTLRILPLIIVAVAVVAAPACNKDEKPADKPSALPGDKPADRPAQPAAEPGDQPGATAAISDGDVRPPTAEDLARYTADLEGTGPLIATFKTSLGEINCELAEKDAPITVANFVGLARGLHPFINPKTDQVEKRPFYDGLTFHRVMPNFMIQGGDMLGTGSGGPGYRFQTETSPRLKHDKAGTLSMANAGPNTNGSQFFITDKATSNLDGGYNVFGYCKETDVVKKIAGVETTFGGSGEKSAPKEPPVIESVTISRGGK